MLCGGFEADLVAERFELADVFALLAGGVGVAQLVSVDAAVDVETTNELTAATTKAAHGPQSAR